MSKSEGTKTTRTFGVLLKNIKLWVSCHILFNFQTQLTRLNILPKAAAVQQIIILAWGFLPCSALVNVSHSRTRHPKMQYPIRGYVNQPRNKWSVSHPRVWHILFSKKRCLSEGCGCSWLRAKKLFQGFVAFETSHGSIPLECHPEKIKRNVFFNWKSLKSLQVSNDYFQPYFCLESSRQPAPGLLIQSQRKKSTEWVHKWYVDYVGWWWKRLLGFIS